MQTLKQPSDSTCEEAYFLYNFQLLSCKLYRQYTPSQVMSDGYFKASDIWKKTTANCEDIISDFNFCF